MQKHLGILSSLFLKIICFVLVQKVWQIWFRKLFLPVLVALVSRRVLDALVVSVVLAVQRKKN